MGWYLAVRSSQQFTFPEYHVLLYDIQWPYGVFYMGTLGPKNLMTGYSDPLAVID